MGKNDQSKTYTPFNPGKKAKSYTPKANEPKSKDHLKQIKTMDGHRFV